MADKSAEKERLFNEWFTKSYDRLRGTLRRYGMLDEDNFHDTYLFVRKQVLVPGKDITDYDAYFVGCYKKAALVKIKERTGMPILKTIFSSDAVRRRSFFPRTT